MRLIPLHNRQKEVVAYAKVDDADHDWLTVRQWSLGSGYAQSRIGGRLVRMHRLIVGLERGDRREVDHHDGDTLNCQRSNLRVVTHAQNLQNRRNGYAGRPVKLRGVTYDKRRGRWAAKVMLAGKTINLGRYDSPEEAGRAASAWREQYMTHTVESTTGR